MRAVLGETVIAEAPEADLIKIEGNWYFPPESVNDGFLEPSPTPYTCWWKGQCQYFNVRQGQEVLQNRAWTYPALIAGAVERVGKDFSNYVAFWKDVTVVE